jgi:hypothetical protein
MQADPNNIEQMRTTLRNIRNHLSHDKESSVGDIVSCELRRAEWFIDLATLVATNSAEIPKLSEQLCKEASAHSHNANRGEDGQVYRGYVWQARTGPNYDLF